MRGLAFVTLLLGAFACSTASRIDSPTAAGNDGGSSEAPDASVFVDGSNCQGLACNTASCSAGETTAIEGVVYDPAGKAKLYNVRVFVPNGELEPFQDGITSCDKCSAPLTGEPIAAALTDEVGHFRLEGVPAGENVPLVIQIGKFRRKIVVPIVDACKTTTVTDGVLTLPKTRLEGDLPRIAVVTGGFDELGCILRRMGIADSEFGAPGSDARIHVYKGAGGAVVAGGGELPSTSLWSDVDTLKKYDAVLLSCEGDEHDDTKPDSAKEAMVQYIGTGGRMFATHYHYTWLKNSPEASFRSVATWNDPASAYGNETDSVDTSFPKGQALAKWLVENGASTTEGEIPIDEPARNVASVDGKLGQTWIANPDAGQPRYFTFNAPVGAAADQQCGRVAFTDIHSRERLGVFTLPTECDPSDMTPQERALEFMLFDLAACIQPDGETPKPPPVK